jgi:hypothetical protein
MLIVIRPSFNGQRTTDFTHRFRRKDIYLSSQAFKEKASLLTIDLQLLTLS